MEKQQNYRNIENMLHEGIVQAVRSLVPVKSILKDFVNHDSASKEDEDSDEEAEKKEELIIPPSVDMNNQEVSNTSDVVMSTAIPEAVPEPVPEPQPVAQPIAPVIVLDDKPTVRFGEFNAMFDSEHPTNSDLIMESNEKEESIVSSDHDSGPVLQILEEEGTSMENDMEIEALDEFNAPSESIGLDDYEEL
jgi:hypothetical protein